MYRRINFSVLKDLEKAKILSTSENKIIFQHQQGSDFEFVIPLSFSITTDSEGSFNIEDISTEEFFRPDTQGLLNKFKQKLDLESFKKIFKNSSFEDSMFFTYFDIKKFDEEFGLVIGVKSNLELSKDSVLFDKLENHIELFIESLLNEDIIFLYKGNFRQDVKNLNIPKGTLGYVYINVATYDIFAI